MKLNYDKAKIKEGIAAKVYDEHNLSISKSGKHRYPSKLMFIRFLEQFKDVDGEADIWSKEDWNSGEVKIYVEVTYKAKLLEGSKVVKE